MGELGYETRTSEMEMRLAMICSDPKFQTFVAVTDGEVCGMIGLCVLPSYEHNDLGGRISALVISETARGQGVGRELIHAAEKWFAGQKVTRIALNTRFHREGAHKFYERLGYTKNGFRFVKDLGGSTSQ